ncbi:hypothetical protein [Pseudomonas sp. CBC3]|uniref:hypothetical protein n=1 Tax=Pseudomonas sp. CBC3 TaxID=3123318 RepID=UPI0030E99E8F
MTIFNQSCIPVPYDDEVLSSWMYRVREVFPDPEVRALYELDYEEALESPLMHAYNGGLSYEVDLDFDFDSQEVIEFVRVYDLSIDWVKSTFGLQNSHFIPLKFKTDYCLRCMDEAVTSIGFPVYLKSWRSIFSPFCIKHRCALRSTNMVLVNSIQFTMDVFEYAYQYPKHLEREDYWFTSTSNVQQLGIIVAERIKLLLLEATEAGIYDEVSSFLMALLRTVLAKDIFTVHPSVMKAEVQYSDGYRSKGPLTPFYQRPFLSTGMARGHAFYMVGLMLGWIDECEASKLQVDFDLYFPFSANCIWQRVANPNRLLIILEFHSTYLLNASMLSGRR